MYPRVYSAPTLAQIGEVGSASCTNVYSLLYIIGNTVLLPQRRLGSQDQRQWWPGSRHIPSSCWLVLYRERTRAFPGGHGSWRPVGWHTPVLLRNNSLEGRVQSEIIMNDEESMFKYIDIAMQATIVFELENQHGVLFCYQISANIHVLKTSTHYKW